MTLLEDRTRVSAVEVVSRVVTDDQALWLAKEGWLASYRGETLRNYRAMIDYWFRWCADHRTPPFTVKRAHIELYAREIAEAGNMPSTVCHKISTVSSFYKWCFLEGTIDRDPAAHVRRPKVVDDGHRSYLDRMEMGRFLATAEGCAPRDYALCTLLALNGLRISEALGANIETMSHERGHHTLNILGKGNKPATIPIGPRCHRALLAYIGSEERTVGPIFLGREGGRLTREAASRIVRRVTKKAGIAKRISPHSLRRSFITDSLDAGVPLRDVQHSARHTDPRTTARYDMNRTSLDTHATYVLSAFVGGS